MTRNRRAQSILYLLGALFSFLLFSGCSGGSSVENDSPAVSNHAESQNLLPAGSLPEELSPLTTSLVKIRQAEQANLLDPNNDGWQSEAFAEMAKGILKKITKQSLYLGSMDKQTLAELIDEKSFFCSELRPSHLREVFHDESFVVRRSEPQAEEEISLYRGLPGLMDAFLELKKLFVRHEEVDVEVKIVRVSIEGEFADTSAILQISGPALHGMVQQNSIWNCHWRLLEKNSASVLTSIRVSSYEEVESLGRKPGEVLFRDCTESVLGDEPSFQDQLAYGIDHWKKRIAGEFDLDPGAFQGIALGDVNGDGLEDLYVCQPGGLPNRLYLQQPNGKLKDVSSAGGVDWLDMSRSALLVDLDNDGDQDLVFTTAKALLVMANDGAGRFSKQFMVSLVAPGASLSAADYDLDGDLDLYVCVYRANPTVHHSGPYLTPVPYHDANNGAPNLLLRNDGQLTFTEVTKETGLDRNNRRFSLAAAWEDYDNDGDMDLYVANDFGRNNLYRNDQGHFVDVAKSAGVEDISAGMSVTWSDYNHDGWMDLYVSNMFSSAGNRIAYQRNFQAQANQAEKQEIQRHARGNSLFLNSGNGTFQDVSVDAAVTGGRWAWTSIFADINNDSWDDLLVANGYVTGDGTDDL